MASQVIKSISQFVTRAAIRQRSKTESSTLIFLGRRFSVLCACGFCHKGEQGKYLFTEAEDTKKMLIQIQCGIRLSILYPSSHTLLMRLFTCQNIRDNLRQKSNIGQGKTAGFGALQFPLSSDKCHFIKAAFMQFKNIAQFSRSRDSRARR